MITKRDVPSITSSSPDVNQISQKYQDQKEDVKNVHQIKHYDWSLYNTQVPWLENMIKWPDVVNGKKENHIWLNHRHDDSGSVER